MTDNTLVERLLRRNGKDEYLDPDALAAAARIEELEEDCHDFAKHIASLLALNAKLERGLQLVREWYHGNDIASGELEEALAASEDKDDDL